MDMALNMPTSRTEWWLQVEIVFWSDFDILYQNEEVFTNDSNTCFLPQIDFAQLYFDTTSVQTKETLWKYLQLILFSIVTSIDSKDSFGANTQLFEAINSDEFKNKLQDTVKQMEGLFNFKKNRVVKVVLFKTTQHYLKKLLQSMLIQK